MTNEKSTEEQYAVVVTRPDSPERPENADLVIRIGPYHSRYWAENAVDSLNATAHQRSRPDGTTITVEPYDEALPHRATLAGAYEHQVVDAMCAEPKGVWAEWSFPDTFDILRTSHGYEEASRLHRGACNQLDAMAEDAEREEREARERAETAAAQVTDLAERMKEQLGMTEPDATRAAALAVAVLTGVTVPEPAAA